MILPGLDRVRHRLHAQSDADRVTRALAPMLDEPFPVFAYDVLKADERTSVFAGELGGVGSKRIIIKTHRASTLGQRLKLLFRRTRLSRQVRGVALLARGGLMTAEPLAHFVGRDTQRNVVETLVLERLPGDTLLRTLAFVAHDEHTHHQLAREVGVLSAALLNAGLFNRDHKPSNIVVLPEPFEPRCVLIDTVGIRRRVPSDAPVRLFANLAAELIGTGLMPSRAVQESAVRAFLEARSTDVHRDAPTPARVERFLASVEERVRALGDHTPKDDPLA